MGDDFESDSSDSEIFNHIAMKDKKSEVFSDINQHVDISAVEERARFQSWKRLGNELDRLAAKR